MLDRAVLDQKLLDLLGVRRRLLLAPVCLGQTDQRLESLSGLLGNPSVLSVEHQAERLNQALLRVEAHDYIHGFGPLAQIPDCLGKVIFRVCVQIALSVDYDLADGAGDWSDLGGPLRLQLGHLLEQPCRLLHKFHWCFRASGGILLKLFVFSGTCGAFRSCIALDDLNERIRGQICRIEHILNLISLSCLHKLAHLQIDLREKGHLPLLFSALLLF